MSDYGIKWGAWDYAEVATVDINATAIANTASLTSDALSNHEKLDTEVSVAIAYGATASQGVIVYVLRDRDGTNYEAVTDLPWGFSLAFAVSATRARTFTVPAQISRFKILLSNGSGAQVAATVRYRQAVGTVLAV